MTTAERTAQWQNARVSTKAVRRPAFWAMRRVNWGAVRSRAAAGARRNRRAALVLCGLGSLVASVWTAWGIAPGLGALGVSFFLIEFLTGEGT